MSKCVVPNCKSTVGVPFPKDSKIKEKWRQGLQLTNAAIKQNSIVCFSHFHPTDLRDDNSTGRRPINRLKRGAVPHINPNDNGDTDDRIELIQLNEDSEKDDKNDEEAKDEKTCRGCLTHKNVESHLFDFFEKRITISAAFTVCIPSISIARDDDLPKYFCNTCLNALKTIYKFRKKWITTDFTLRMNRKRRRSLITKSEEEIMKKKCLKIDPNSEKQPALVISASDDFEVIYEDSICQEADDYQDPTQLEEKLLLQGTSEEKSLDMDDIEKNMEEIHGNNLSKNFVSEPTSDLSSNAEDDSVLENEQGATVEDILSTLEGGVIGERQEQGVQVSKKIVTKSKFPLVNTTKKDILPMYIKLPKGTKIKPLEYYSKVGQYSSKIRYGVYESVFIEADEYLFEIGLAKCTVRHLRCALPTCASQGKQLVNDNGDISTIVHVTTPHNHPAPNEAAKKKQMFLCLMRKKMQTDRTLNIRHIYEDACIQDPEIREVVPLRNVINEICRHQLMHKLKPVNSFEDFFSSIESDSYEKLHFTHCNQQFYQQKFYVSEDSSMAVVFGNTEIIQLTYESKIMYVDASFKIDSCEDFKYQLVTVLVWIENSYYPILFALVNKKSQLIFRKVFGYLHDQLAPELRPQEIITDYEANLYYALAEIYVDSNIGGSVFYYTQNLYKKICSLNLSRDLETNSYFRNVYHMLLMLPLLPVNTILDGLNSIELEAKNLNISSLARPVFDHVRTQWILNVTPELFCVHKLENRINENVIAPFKKLRDFLLLTKSKVQKSHITVIHVVEKLIELEGFLRGTYSRSDKKSFGRDLSSFQKKNVLRAWQFIEDHPKIEISNFFSKVLGYIKCMENQLWIWGFYRYDGDTDDILINATHFSIVSPNDEVTEDVSEETQEEYLDYMETQENTIVMEAVIDQDGVLQTSQEIPEDEDMTENKDTQQFESEFLKYVYQ